MVATFIKEVDGSILVDALIVISESHTPTVARPEPKGIPPPELMLIVVAAMAPDDRSPKSKKKSRNGLLKTLFKTTPPAISVETDRNRKFPPFECLMKIKPTVSPK